MAVHGATRDGGSQNRCCVASLDLHRQYVCRIYNNKIQSVAGACVIMTVRRVFSYSMHGIIIII